MNSQRSANEIARDIEHIDDLLNDNRALRSEVERARNEALETLRQKMLDLYERKGVLTREYDQAFYKETGKIRCNKCSHYIDEPGGMISDDSYSQFQCPFHNY